MNTRETNQASFRRLKPSLDKSYPHGQFVAIDGGQVVADAPSFEELDQKLLGLGKESPDVLVVQAGHEYPEWVDIFI